VSDWLGLDGERVLIAGGAGALGAALAAGFLGAGSRVLAVDRDEKGLERLAAATGGRLAAGVIADLGDAEECRRAVADAHRAMDGIDVFVHCAGVNDRCPLEAYGDDDRSRIVAVNVSSAFWTLQAVLPGMRDRRHGRIVCFSSVAGRSGHKHHRPYAASNGAINQLVRVAANEYAADGVTVNAVAPGYIDTALTERYLAESSATREQLIELIPAGRFGTLPEVVGPVLFLSSPHASFITGQILYIDGGRSVV
jgi:NAD(P)-dependent dehydrogenase (short-subunit alcohol dehydrogenase family)